MKTLKELVANSLLRTAIVVFLVTLTLYLANLPYDFAKNMEKGNPRRLVTSNDAVANIFLPYLLYKHHTFDYWQIKDEIKNYITDTAYYLVEVDEHYYPKYPVLSGLMAFPFYLPALILNKLPDLNTMRNVYKICVMGRITASIYASMSVALFYLIIKRLEKKLPHISYQKYYKYILWLSVVAYAMGSNTYTISSRVLWQHTTAQFILSISILLFFYSFSKPRLIMWQGLLMGLMVLARPTNIMVAIPIALFVFIYFRKQFLLFILAALPTVIFLALYNYFLYGSVTTEGYQLGDKLVFNTPIITGLAGLLLSPGKGFLFTMPLYFIGFYEMIKTLVHKSKDTLYVTLRFFAIAFLLALILAAKWRAWEGGDRFGPGLVTDVLPIIAVFSYLTLVKVKSRVILVLVTLLTVYSLLVHFNAVIFRKSRCSDEHSWTFYCLTPPREWPDY